jgi:diguanylate cyclase (GGDEF)-like protein
LKAKTLSWIYFLVFCVLLVVVAVVDLRVSHKQAAQAAADRVESTAYLIAEWVKGAFLASDYVLRDIVDEVPVSELVFPHPDPERHARVTAYIDSKRQIIPHATGVGLNDANCIVTHTLSLVGFDASEREWCATPRAKAGLETHVSNMFVSNIGELMVIQARRFPGDGFLGLAGIGLNLEFFSAWLDSISMQPHALVAIVDGNRSLLGARPVVAEALGNTVDAPLLERFMASGEPHGTLRGRSALDGENRILAFRWAGDLPFIVIVGEADRDWLANWWRQAATSAVVLFLFMLMGLVILREHLAVLRQREELRLVAQSDFLTGVANRRHFITLAEAELRRARRFEEPFAVLMLDIDYFKSINDTHGHALGDRAIVEFSRACQVTLREVDVLGRFGGDEFAILLPNVSDEGARTLAKRIGEAVRGIVLRDDAGNPVSLTASIGGVVVHKPEQELDEIIARADAALYRAKERGRDRAEFWDGAE